MNVHISNIGLAIHGFSEYSNADRPRCQIHVCRSSVLSKLSSKLKLQRSFNQFRWLVLDIYLDFLGCVKSCGRLPDCSVLSPPELALEVIWWNVAFCLLLVDLLLQKRQKKGYIALNCFQGNKTTPHSKPQSSQTIFEQI